MILKLFNFKCHNDSVFNFKEDGVSLLCGQSGKGKSSIVQAIVFALQGIGNKLISYGKSSCKVEFISSQIKIVRTKGPNSLIVNDNVYNDEAQSIINDYIGKHFNITGYIPQNNNKSFIMMTSQDKLEFLEQYVFSDNELIKIKESYKNKIQETTKYATSIQSKIDILKQLNGSKQVKDIDKFPCDYCNSLEELEDKYRILTEKYQLKQTSLNNITSKISEQEILNVSYKDYNFKRLNTEDKLITLTNEIDNLNHIFVGEENLLQIKKKLLSISLNRDYIQLKKSIEEDKKQIEKLRTEKIESLLAKKQTIENNLWQEYSKDEIDEIIKDTEQLHLDVSKLKKLYDLINTYKNNSMTILDLQQTIKHKEKLNQLIYNCPECNSHLIIKNNLLYKTEDTQCLQNKDEIKDDIINLKKLLDMKIKYEDILNLYTDEKLPSKEDVQTDLNYLNQYKLQQIYNEKELKNITEQLTEIDLCSMINCLIKSLNIKEEKISNMEMVDIDSDVDENKLHDEFDNQSSLFAQIKEKNTIRQLLSANLKEYSDAIYKIQSNPIFSLKCLDQQLKTLENEVAFLKTDIIKVKSDIKLVTQWLYLKKEFQEYTKICNQIQELEDEEKVLRNKLTGYLKLKDAVLQSESIVIENFVNYINTHAKIYLDSFFEEDTINSYLTCFKENTKTQINLIIEYKNMVCDFSMLSGGESARIILAYTLALSEIFNTPLLLLDECTASLDEETANSVFETINNNFKGKMCLIIAHQVITGSFDKILTI